MKTKRQAGGLGGILGFHIGASHFLVPRAFEGAHNILTTPTDRRDDLAELGGRGRTPVQNNRAPKDVRRREGVKKGRVFVLHVCGACASWSLGE